MLGNLLFYFVIVKQNIVVVLVIGSLSLDWCAGAVCVSLCYIYVGFVQ